MKPKKDDYEPENKYEDFDGEDTADYYDERYDEPEMAESARATRRDLS